MLNKNYWLIFVELYTVFDKSKISTENWFLVNREIIQMTINYGLVLGGLFWQDQALRANKHYYNRTTKLNKLSELSLENVDIE